MSESAAPRAVLYRRVLITDRGVIERFGDPFRPLEPECKVIQFAEPLAAAQLQAAGGLIADRPDVQLYVYGDASTNLDFLRYFGTLRRLQVALYKLEDITGFSHVRYLEELTFGETKRTFSLRFLGALPHLKALFLVGHKKDLPAICDLSELTDLGFSQITLSDLSLILPLTNCESSRTCWAAPAISRRWESFRNSKSCF